MLLLWTQKEWCYLRVEQWIAELPSAVGCPEGWDKFSRVDYILGGRQIAKLPPQRHQSDLKKYLSHSCTQWQQDALLCEDTWNTEVPCWTAISRPSLLVDVACTAAVSAVRRWQVMLLCSAVRIDLKSGGCLWPALVFCPLATHRQELSAPLWSSLMRLTNVSSCSAHRSEAARARMRQQQGYSCTPMHAVSECIAVWESWPGLIKALCLICSTLKAGHPKASRR